MFSDAGITTKSITWRKTVFFLFVLVKQFSSVEPHVTPSYSHLPEKPTLDLALFHFSFYGLVIRNPVHLFFETAEPGRSSPHLKQENAQLFSRWFSCVTKYGIVLPHFAGGMRLQMPLWIITVVLKWCWQVSTDERFCIELIKLDCFCSSSHC